MVISAWSNSLFFSTGQPQSLGKRKKETQTSANQTHTRTAERKENDKKGCQKTVRLVCSGGRRWCHSQLAIGHLFSSPPKQTGTLPPSPFTRSKQREWGDRFPALNIIPGQYIFFSQRVILLPLFILSSRKRGRNDIFRQTVGNR